MEAVIKVAVDDELLRAHVADHYERLRADGFTGPFPEPDGYVMERLRDVCSDELSVALWGWAEKLGLTLEVEQV